MKGLLLLEKAQEINLMLERKGSRSHHYTRRKVNVLDAILLLESTSLRTGTLLLQTCKAQLRQTHKYGINKKSTIFKESLRNLVD